MKFRKINCLAICAAITILVLHVPTQSWAQEKDRTTKETPESNEPADWDGQWITDHGIMELKTEGQRISGTYGDGGTISGVVKRDVTEKVELNFRNGNSRGTLTVERSEDGLAFDGQWASRGNGGLWRGWKVDPDAEDAETADFSGYWMTSWGPMRVEQNDTEVTGTFSANGWGKFTGTVAGRRMTIDRKYIRFENQAWLEMSPDGSRMYGLNLFDKPAEWTGIRLPDFSADAKPQADETVKGISESGMLYHLRMPTGWEPGDEVDVVVLLHGSNWTTAGMVYITNDNWPDIGKKFAILGIQGESWNKYSDAESPTFNYTYQNWMGRSTYGGYPFTDRESPYLVTNVIKELSTANNFKRIFVGGHSQGGFLTHIIHMNFPELIDGTFPIAGGLAIQAYAEAFDDEELMTSQREMPMAIVHSKNDRVVSYSASRDIYNRRIEDGFDHLIRVDSNNGHGYDFLPVNQAIEFLDMMTTDNKSEIKDYLQRMAEEKQWRIVGEVLQHATEIGAGDSVDAVAEDFEKAAARDAVTLLKKIQANRNSDWAEDYLDWHEQFSKATAGKQTVAAFNALREQHADDAETVMERYRDARNQRQYDQAKKILGEIVQSHYTSKYYRHAVQSLEQR